jgi:hypothetical protein
VIKFLICFCLFLSSISFAETYKEFNERVNAESQSKRTDGFGYLVSGGIALVGGSYGWSQSKSSVEKGFYSIAQSMGILAIGYGAEAYFLKQDDEIFLTVLSSTELSRAQKDKMVESYLRERKEREESVVWIRRVTFGLAGVLSAVNAAQTKDQTLQNILYVSAGVQLAWAFTF